MSRRSTVLLAIGVALAAISLWSTAADRPGGRPPPDEPRADARFAAVSDPRRPADTMPDPRGRTLVPEAACTSPARRAEGPTPRCAVSFGRPLTAVGVGPRLAIAALAHAATVGWSLPQARADVIFEPLPPELEARAIAVVADGRSAVFGVGGELWRYDTRSGRRTARGGGPGGTIEALAATRDGARIAVIDGADGRAHLLAEDGSVERTFAAEGRAVAIALDRSGRRAAVATDTGAVAVFELGTSEAPARVFAPSLEPAAAVGFAGERILVAGRDGVLRALDASSGRELARAEVGVSLVRLALSRDGRLAATAAADRVVRLHRVADLEVAAALDWHRAGLAALGFAAGPTLVTADNDGDLAVWDLDPSGRPKER